MLAKITLISARERLLHEYSAEWKINELSRLRTRSCRTPSFSPILNFELSFCFEIMYHEFNHVMENVNDRASAEPYAASILKLALMKTSDSNIPPFWKMNVDVIVKYSSDGTVFKKYNRSEVSVSMISFPICVKKHSSNHGSKISDGFTMECKFVFNNCLSSLADYNEEKHCRKRLERFVDNFSNIFQPIVLSDIELKFGKKSLQAHKSILAAHSPVFMKMFTQDFLESKNNIVLINDFSYEAFKCFLEFLYCGEIEDKSWSSIKDLYAIAHKYDIGVLKQVCSDLCPSIISCDNFCEILELAYFYDDLCLQTVTKRFANDHIQDILHRDEWEQLVAIHPKIGYEVMLNIVKK